MLKIQVLGAASHLPEQVVTSKELFQEIKSEQRYGLPDNWMVDNMGIVERRLSGIIQPSKLAIPAAEKAIISARVSNEDIGLVIFCGIERDFQEPATAHYISQKLELSPTHAFDISNACYGFVEGIQTASLYIKSGIVKNALVVTAEVASGVTNTVIELLKKGMTVDTAKNYLGGLSIGDAGGAVILGESINGRTGFNIFNKLTLPRHADKCFYKFEHDGSFNGTMKMAGISAAMLSGHKKLNDATMTQLKLKKPDFVISHQVGRKPWERISEIANVNESRHIKTFDRLGNIASATFPVNFEMLLNSDTVEGKSQVVGYFAGSGLVLGQIGYTI